MAFCKHCGAQVADDAGNCHLCNRPIRRPGKTCLAVLAGCGCLAVAAAVALLVTILVPSFKSARENVAARSEQDRTVADLRGVGAALMSWYADHGDGPELAGLPELPSAADLTPLLVPDYVAEVPAADGWGHPLEYWIYRVRSDGRFVRIRSPGRDGVFEAESYAPEAFPAADYDRDVVWADGEFVRWPETP